MKIKKGQKLKILDSRKGNYNAIATECFDTITNEWYSVKLDQDIVEGMNTFWEKGEEVPCRRGLSKVRIRE